MNLNADQRKMAREAERRNVYHEERPLQSGRTRTSYQDSNLFQNKDLNIGTVQPGAHKEATEQRMRSTNTFSSSVFGGPTSNCYEDTGIKVKGILDNMGPDASQKGRE